MDRPPYFAFYPNDFAGDINVEAMSTLQVGAYMLLLCKAWQADPPASLPNDDSQLARFARVEAGVWAEIKSGVMGAFRFGSDGRWHSKRLRLEYDKALQLIKRRKLAGKSGAEARWTQQNGEENGKRIANALRSHCDGNGIQSQNQTKNKEQLPSEVGGASPPPPVTATDESSDKGTTKKPKRAKKPAKAKTPDELPTPGHVEARDEFCRRWRECHGTDYLWDYGKYGMKLNRVLKLVGSDLAVMGKMYDRFFADTSQFRTGKAHSFDYFANSPAEWLGEPTTQTPKPRFTPPPTREQQQVDSALKHAIDAGLVSKPEPQPAPEPLALPEPTYGDGF